MTCKKNNTSQSCVIECLHCLFNCDETICHIHFNVISLPQTAKGEAAVCDMLTCQQKKTT